ncbi:MAG: hypothetical protein ACO1G7_07105 [Bacteroidota bacterium]|jgi:hypothetical protein|nr:hypothetical protein [Bacteroidia bacterium]HRU60515.1 hypothetical protein [Bacteroidia bacterium]
MTFNRTNRFPLFRLVCICALLVPFLLSCKKEKQDPLPISFDYFPTERGRFVIFEVDSIVHAENDNNNDDSVYTFHYEVLEQIDSSFIDGSGRSAQVLKRYHRLTDGDPWNLTSVWTQTLTVSAAYRFEDNITFHKLAFPISENTTWDGNDMNTLDEELYAYEDYHVSRSVNGMAFDSTLSVLQRDDNNFVERVYGQEIYANGVGLIRRQRDDLGKRNGIVVKGTEFTMQVKDYGPR